MALTEEQAKELKKQLSDQIKNMPEEQRAAAQKQIDDMSPEALEEMVKQQQSGGGSQKGIFRMIVDGEVPSKKLDENKEVIAVVSKRAQAKGHVLIIPKKPVGDGNSVPSSAFVMAKKFGKKMDTKLGASSCQIQTVAVFGEVVVNVIPVYEGKEETQAYEASEEEMEEVYQKMRVVKKPKTITVKKKEVEEEKILKLKRKIP